MPSARGGRVAIEGNLDDGSVGGPALDLEGAPWPRVGALARIAPRTHAALARVFEDPPRSSGWCWFMKGDGRLWGDPVDENGRRVGVRVQCDSMRPGLAPTFRLEMTAHALWADVGDLLARWRGAGDLPRGLSAQEFEARLPRCATPFGVRGVGVRLDCSGQVWSEEDVLAAVARMDDALAKASRGAEVYARCAGPAALAREEAALEIARMRGAHAARALAAVAHSLEGALAAAGAPLLVDPSARACFEDAARGDDRLDEAPPARWAPAFQWCADAITSPPEARDGGAAAWAGLLVRAVACRAPDPFRLCLAGRDGADLWLRLCDAHDAVEPARLALLEIDEDEGAVRARLRSALDSLGAR